MRIAIDGTTLCAPDGSRGAGIEHYSWSIAMALLRSGSSHEFFISTPPAMSRVRRQELLHTEARVKLLPSWGPKLSFVSRHAILPLRFWLYRPDVLFSPFGQLPLGWRGKSVVTVHDLAIYEHPEWFPSEQSFSTRVVVPRSLEHATQLIAVSSATQQKIHERLPTTAGRVHVVHEGVDLAEAYEALKGADASTRFPFDRDFCVVLGHDRAAEEFAPCLARVSCIFGGSTGASGFGALYRRGEKRLAYARDRRGTGGSQSRVA